MGYLDKNGLAYLWGKIKAALGQKLDADQGLTAEQADARYMGRLGGSLETAIDDVSFTASITLGPEGGGGESGASVLSESPLEQFTPSVYLSASEMSYYGGPYSTIEVSPSAIRMMCTGGVMSMDATQWAINAPGGVMHCNEFGISIYGCAEPYADDMPATKGYVDGLIGGISTLLDEINGEVV